MKKFLYLVVLLPMSLFAQNSDEFSFTTSRAFEHYEVGATFGSTGLGLDVKTNINQDFKLRAGFSFMPQIGNVEGYTLDAVGGEYVDPKVSSKTQRLAELLGDMIGSKSVNDVIDMERKVGYFNAKVLVDWYPLEDKKWHVTAGFFWGSKKIGKAINTIEEGPTTTAILMYNQMYDQIQVLDKYEYPTLTIGSHSYELDPIAGKEVKESFNYYGRIAVQLGKYPDGTPFYTEPNEDAVIKADAIANAFKPYIGVGYDTSLNRDERWKLGFDAGLMYWGTPHIYSSGYKYHENAETYEEKMEHVDKVCLVHDLTKTSGAVNNYINLFKKLPLFPVIEIKLAYSIF